MVRLARLWKWLFLLFLLLFFVSIWQLQQTPLLALTALGQDAVGFQGITKEQVRLAQKSLSPEALEDIEDTRGLEIRAALDCSSFSCRRRSKKPRTTAWILTA